MDLRNVVVDFFFGGDILPFFFVVLTESTEVSSVILFSASLQETMSKMNRYIRGEKPFRFHMGSFFYQNNKSLVRQVVKLVHRK
jgi:hypothetical protein